MVIPAGPLPLIAARAVIHPGSGSPAFAGTSGAAAHADLHMIYELDGQKPDLPQEGRYWIAPSAAVIGKVRLKNDSSVWFNAVMRGDNEWIELGERSQIQDNATLHTDMGFPLTIGPDCVIGHNVILHGCTIGERALIGMGAIVLNGARIGAGSLVGAGALVTEGKEFPERSLIVGSPARVIRSLDDAAVAAIAAGADIYVRNFKRFAKGMKPVG
jgi:carbonic anhydrase/acetyltransferase-like protein (isoleucine patch superfamily)